MDLGKTRLYIGDLPGDVTEDDLRAFFQDFGAIVNVTIPPGKGYGFVQFLQHKDAEIALQSMYGYRLGNTSISTSWARNQPARHYNYPRQPDVFDTATINRNVWSLAGSDGIEFGNFPHGHGHEVSANTSNVTLQIVLRQIEMHVANHSPIPDSLFAELSMALKDTGEADGSNCPRIWTVLNLIGARQFVSAFAAAGIDDTALPLKEPRYIPRKLNSSSARDKFIENQAAVLSQGQGLESLWSDGRHRNFANGDEHYESLADLGSGNNGYVDKVKNTHNHKIYARKCFPKAEGYEKSLELIKRFTHEVKTLHNLSHRHLITFEASYTDFDYVAIIMSPVARCDLAAYLQINLSPAEKPQMRRYFGCLASGLRYLHLNKIRHKDIKTSNLLVTDQGGILITDFGSALQWADSGASTTMGKEIVGITKDFCAPEVLKSLAAHNSLSDVYSLGVVYLHLETVLKGESIQDMRTWLVEHGSYKSSPCENQDAIKTWIDLLRQRDDRLESEDNIPLRWIVDMMHQESGERPPLDFVLGAIFDTGQSTKFCCRECRNEKSSGSHRHSRLNGVGQADRSRTASTSSLPQQDTYRFKSGDLYSGTPSRSSAFGSLRPNLHPQPLYPIDSEFDPAAELSTNSVINPLPRPPIPYQQQLRGSHETFRPSLVEDAEDRLRATVQGQRSWGSEYPGHAYSMLPTSRQTSTRNHEQTKLRSKPAGQQGITNQASTGIEAHRKNTGQTSTTTVEYGTLKDESMLSTNPLNRDRSLIFHEQKGQEKVESFTGKSKTFKESSNTQQLSSKSVTATPDLKPKSSSSGTSEDSSHAPKNDVPKYSTIAEVEILESFKRFASSEKERLARYRRDFTKKQKKVQLTELRDFAKTFKLTSPVPADLLPIIAPDETMNTQPSKATRAKPPPLVSSEVTSIHDENRSVELRARLDDTKIPPLDKVVNKGSDVAVRAKPKTRKVMFEAQYETEASEHDKRTQSEEYAQGKPHETTKRHPKTWADIAAKK